MSNWNTLPPPPLPPPRISRSRSPSRTSYGQRGPYPDALHPPDPYRAEWDAYNRDRAWVEWERDRATYEHGRRGRSRSPPFDEGALCQEEAFSTIEDTYTIFQEDVKGDAPFRLMNVNVMNRDLVIMMIMVFVSYFSTQDPYLNFISRCSFAELRIHVS